jgi:anaphase-promoting complex subunit 1
VRVKVVGDRYWPVEVDLTALETRAASLELLYGRRQLPVQRLTGALPYAADPTGARAGLARALHAAAAASLRPPKLWFNCDENNDDATGVAVRASTYGSSALQQDAVGVFTSDPALLGFKRLMCGHVGAADAAAGGARGILPSRAARVHVTRGTVRFTRVRGHARLRGGAAIQGG